MKMGMDGLGAIDDVFGELAACEISVIVTPIVSAIRGSVGCGGATMRRKGTLGRGGKAEEFISRLERAIFSERHEGGVC